MPNRMLWRRCSPFAALAAAALFSLGACTPSHTDRTESTDTLTTSKRVKDTTVVKRDVTVKTDTLKSTTHTKP
jgi:hypothetical protein